MKLNELFETTIFIPQGNLNIPRRNMPQVAEEHQKEYFEYLKDHGAEVKLTKVLAKQLKPTQKEINVKAVEDLVKSGSSKLNKPIIVSADGFVIDGHHRWLATLNKNEEGKVNVAISKAPVRRLLVLTRDFDKSLFRDKHNQEYRDINTSLEH